MTPSAHPPPRKARGLRAVALVALGSLACTTVRVPASGIDSAVRIEGDVAEPQVELWIESSDRVSPAEAAQASAEARAALAQALSGRRLAEGEQLLVVRAQGVTRTGSRRADQTAAIAGIAIAAVAIVAVVVVAIVATQGKGGGAPRVPAVHAAPHVARPAAAPAVRAAPAVARAAPVRVSVPTSVPRPPRPPVAATRTFVAPPRPRAAPASHSQAAVALDLDVQIGGPAPAEPPPAVFYESVETTTLEAPPPPPEPASSQVVLVPPAPLDLSRRGFFAKDAIRVELWLVDRATGTPLWVKTVEKSIDPRNGRAVRALLDAALDQPGGWEAAPVPAPTPAPAFM